MKSIFPATLVLFLTLCMHCKSWDKFWDGGTVATSSFVLSDKVNFSSANFQASIYSGNSLWNDYVKNDGAPLPVTLVSSPFTSGSSATGQSTRLTATGTACSATQTGGYGTCIHAGMIRSFTISGLTTCAGLQVDDSLGAFHWVCDPSATPLRIASVGFKEGKYLSDLIDFTNVKFKAMSVTVSYQGQSVTSTPSVWWGNSVQNLAGTSYGVASGIYLMQTNPNSASVITPLADKTALLIRPGVKLTTTSASAAVNNSTRNFSWYEGIIDLNGSGSGAIGFAMGPGAYVVLQNFSIINAPPGLSSSYQIGGRNGYFRDVRYANATIANQRSFDLIAGSDSNLLVGVQSSNDETALTMNGANNILMNVTMSNGSQFSTFNATSTNNLIQNFTLTNTNSGGSGAIRFNFAGNAYNTLANLNVANTPSPAVHFFSTSTFAQIINFTGSVNSATIMNASAGTYAYIGGVVAVGNGAAATCGGGCAQCGFSGTCTPTDASDFTLVNSTLNPMNSFSGKVVVDDPQNASDSSGLATYAASNDWLNFAGRYRNYGQDGGAFPIGANQGRCTAGPTCRIWDWSLLSSDNQYRNLLPAPNGNMVAGHKWSAVSQLTCTQPGATWFNSGTCDRPPYPGTSASCAAIVGTFTNAGCFTIFLRNAYEIIDDGIGNDNGLCESNEACIYTPNIASYQGHGSLTCIRGPADLGCTSLFTNGTISNVVLYQYATNGY